MMSSAVLSSQRESVCLVYQRECVFGLSESVCVWSIRESVCLVYQRECVFGLSERVCVWSVRESVCLVYQGEFVLGLTLHGDGKALCMRAATDWEVSLGWGGLMRMSCSRTRVCFRPLMPSQPVNPVSRALGLAFNESLLGMTSIWLDSGPFSIVQCKQLWVTGDG
ncbi:hypothetical protein J4Q44_G00063960 [Coregonus suidteri]|uniref:Uncharacterized protein n=1 Tax=Coregonus suidteri TaxID=861788 RepID=A0AAN8MCN1_9TELE